MTTQIDRDQLARAAFWGSNAALSAYLDELDGYELDGIWWPANSMTLARAIELMEALTEEQIGDLVARGIIGEAA